MLDLRKKPGQTVCCHGGMVDVDLICVPSKYM